MTYDLPQRVETRMGRFGLSAIWAVLAVIVGIPLPARATQRNEGIGAASLVA